ncbi:response regulator [Luteolibacter ambystomatis]|uniref:Response regulator n=1 Tax=Luteolibacter ambystomatis TaxID=2824561 RepID=A0A975PHB0_9BACT|nr:response regulator [Luteolibacter ambystomatis]QUE53142.1 response regulator [Luteolibacter ambystomatis]
MNETYSPVALIVDDDEAVVARLSRNFLRETSMGVLVAQTLSEAADLIENDDVRIDALVMDLNFREGTRDDSRDLRDGLDFIQFAQKARQEVPTAVVSVEGDDADRKTQAQRMKIRVNSWHPKLGQQPGPLSPWATVERACLTKTLKTDRDFRSRLKQLGIEVQDLLTDEAIAEKVRKVVRFPRLTYLTNLGSDFEAIRPIEVICSQVGKGRYSASAIQIGMLTSGEGENLDEAVEDLAGILVEEAKLYLSGDYEPMGYAAKVRDNLLSFLKPVSA